MILIKCKLFQIFRVIRDRNYKSSNRRACSICTTYFDWGMVVIILIKTFFLYERNAVVVTRTKLIGWDYPRPLRFRFELRSELRVITHFFHHLYFWLSDFIVLFVNFLRWNSVWTSVIIFCLKNESFYFTVKGCFLNFYLFQVFNVFASSQCAFAHIVSIYFVEGNVETLR